MSWKVLEFWLFFCGNPVISSYDLPLLYAFFALSALKNISLRAAGFLLLWNISMNLKGTNYVYSGLEYAFFINQISTCKNLQPSKSYFFKEIINKPPVYLFPRLKWKKLLEKIQGVVIFLSTNNSQCELSPICLLCNLYSIRRNSIKILCTIFNYSFLEIKFWPIPKLLGATSPLGKKLLWRNWLYFNQ